MKVIKLVSQMDVLRKELGLLKRQSFKFEARVVKVEEKILLHKQELPKRLEDSANEVVGNFQQSEAFTMQAAL